MRKRVRRLQNRRLMSLQSNYASPPAIAYPYSAVPACESKLEQEEERVAQDEEMQIWIQESMAQVAALQQYAVICIVLSGFAFSGLVSLDHTQIKEDLNFHIGGLHIGWALVFSLTLSIAICIACGIYATLIFTLCSIYCAVAVSHGDQAGFVSFMARTSSIRVGAFLAFKGSLMSMVSSIVLILLAILPHWEAFAIVIPTLGITIAGVCNAGKVMGIAKAELGHMSMAQYHKKAIGKEEAEWIDEENSEEDESARDMSIV